MNDSWIPISNNAHAKCYWLPKANYAFAAEYQIIEVLAHEISSLLPHYALAFINKGNETRLVAILGLGGEANLYVHTDLKWACKSIPRLLQCYPFAIIPDSASGKKIFCVNENSISKREEGIPFYDDGGTLGRETMKIYERLKKNEYQKEETRNACRLLSESGLLVPWHINFKISDDRDPVKIKGLYKIDEESLHTLPSEILASVRDVGGLTIAYGQMFSSSRVNMLAERAQYLAEQYGLNEPENSRISSLLGSQDILNFDSL